MVPILFEVLHEGFVTPAGRSRCDRADPPIGSGADRRIRIRIRCGHDGGADPLARQGYHRHRYGAAAPAADHQHLDQRGRCRGSCPAGADEQRRPAAQRARAARRILGRRGQCQYRGARPARGRWRRQVRPVPGGRAAGARLRRYRLRHRRYLPAPRLHRPARRGGARRIGVHLHQQRARRGDQLHQQDRRRRRRGGRRQPRHGFRPDADRRRLRHPARPGLDLPRRRLLPDRPRPQGCRLHRRARRSAQGQCHAQIRQRLHPAPRQIARRPHAAVRAGAGADHRHRRRARLYRLPRLRPARGHRPVALFPQRPGDRRGRQPDRRGPRRRLSHPHPRGRRAGVVRSRRRRHRLRPVPTSRATRDRPPPPIRGWSRRSPRWRRRSAATARRCAMPAGRAPAAGSPTPPRSTATASASTPSPSA